jgi:adenosylhomocysteine nucleosidase
VNGAAPAASLAIVGAMAQELAGVWSALQADARFTPAAAVDTAGRRFQRGEWRGRRPYKIWLVQSGIGKVAAATTAALLLERFDVGALLLTGVAGGLADGVRVGDIVIADALLQHDLDVSPIFPRWQVPSHGRARFETDAAMAAQMAAGAERVLAERPASGAQVHRGLIVSGDRFVSRRTESDALRAALPDALAVEMEGAAMAQVCADYGRPLAVMRTISDRADDDAHADFTRFLDEVAAPVSRALVMALLDAM